MPPIPLVCIIDDDESVRESVGDLVQSLGYKTATFASAEEYLQSDHVENSSCVITDVRMPGMDGLELQEKLKTCGAHIPIVFITAHYDASAREHAMEAGAVEFIQKPFNEEVLLKAVDSGLRLSQDMEAN